MTHTVPAEDRGVDPLAFLDQLANEQAAQLTEAQREHLLLAFAFFRRNKAFCPAPAESPNTSGDENNGNE